MLEMKSLQDEPVEGFKITLVDESDMYNWEVAIFGPPNTHYEGGYFKARIKFPVDYPYSPPAFRFLTKMWHPNIYENGDVCISILHPPVDDPQSGELPSERWNPTQNVRTILLSVISLLNEPNTFSPANVDASVMYRKWRDSKGKDREYIEIIRKQVLATKADAERDGVKVPITLDEYCEWSLPVVVVVVVSSSSSREECNITGNLTKQCCEETASTGHQVSSARRSTDSGGLTC
ncbi:hypothetical protein F2P81_005756 [Scophthalmus maximus]|uniref:E2 ubiquitin-conjugating enzyme n=1 Tax=Scophthalmus maximus TaxID=52904 RepID=A0A6A4TG69_SCOMX|nr:hypothetical protein F2P81_005756 [Scophthalmus maximus]